MKTVFCRQLCKQDESAHSSQWPQRILCILLLAIANNSTIRLFVRFEATLSLRTGGYADLEAHLSKPPYHGDPLVTSPGRSEFFRAQGKAMQGGLETSKNVCAYVARL
jgi:hypothetical protein